MTTPDRPVAPVVALDIGNVCVDLQLDRCARNFGYESFAALKTSAPSFFAIADEFERGRLTAAEFFATVQRTVPARLDAAGLEAAWISLIGDEIEGMADVVEWIHAHGLRPVFISDICPVHHGYLRRTLSFAHRVPDEVVSYRVGQQKPHAAMYQAVEDGFCGGGVPALYTDDRLDNIRGARARGWRAYHFAGVAGLRRELDAIAP